MASHLNSRSSRSFGLVMISIVWAAFLTVVGSPEVLLFTVPVFMLAAPLAIGRYLGDGLIEKLARTGRGHSRAGRGDSPAFRGLLAGSTPGSLLIASNLAGRAPPVSAP